MKTRLIVIQLFYILIFSDAPSLMSQIDLPADGGGSAEFEKHTAPCISNSERQHVNEIIIENIKKYKIQTEPKKMIVLYDWPIAQNPIFDFNSTYGISNFVDHDPAYPNQLEDWNCGQNTYDTPNGYNHQGIDIFLWPFDENQVDNEQTWAVAAAAGTILAKNDGEPDDNCAFNNNTANYVILSHSDGSRSWYWHLKLNSVLTKPIGSSVAAGEYLGVIASSGNSTGPHLHFECYDENLDLIDPYSGTCNNLNTSTFWNTQKPYWEPTINTLYVHHAPPSFQACPNLDIPNIATNIQLGQTAYYVGYFHDLQTSNSTSYEINRPDGSTWDSWTHSPSSTFRGSYWYWTRTIPTSEVEGVWTFEATLNGHTEIREIVVGTPCPSSYSSANGNPLTGSQSASFDFETNGIIESSQIISGSSTIVDYDSGTSICLDPGFEVTNGSIFHAFIEGCFGAQINNQNESTKN